MEKRRKKEVSLLGAALIIAVPIYLLLIGVMLGYALTYSDAQELIEFNTIKQNQLYDSINDCVDRVYWLRELVQHQAEVTK